MEEIIAKEWLTQSHIENEAERIFVRKVMTPNAELWREATQTEKDEWEAEHQAEEPLAE